MAERITDVCRALWLRHTGEELEIGLRASDTHADRAQDEALATLSSVVNRQIAKKTRAPHAEERASSTSCEAQ